MKNLGKIIFLLGLSLELGCSANEDFVIAKEAPQKEKTNISISRNELSIGVENAVKKARQMTDILFTPRDLIEFNNGTYQSGETYKGLIYSSVKETDTFVGECISFHTFITAVNNPRSKLYTERMDQYPYHGTNCKAYYGTVCSGLVSYALGLVPRYQSCDFPESDLMDFVDYSNLENLQVADILWRQGHVAIITDIIKSDSNSVSSIEICESPSYNCKRYTVSRDRFFNEIMSQKFNSVYRYREIENNIHISDFDINDTDNIVVCVDKGDKSCYLEGEEVTINILTEECDSMEIYKDGILYLTSRQIQGKDVVLENLTYGDYMARVIQNKETTGIHFPQMTRRTNISNCETYWKVVNTEMDLDVNNNTLFFKSLNARPLYVTCCKKNGSRPHLKNGFYHMFSQDEIDAGYINVDIDKLDESYTYMKIIFETDYGLIINSPIYWVNVQ